MNRLLAILGLVLITSPALAQVPPNQGRVTDLAGLYSPQEREALATRLKAIEKTREDSPQVIVLTVNQVPDRDITTFGVNVVEKWKPGKKDRDSGMLILIQANKSGGKDIRNVRFEVGYGLEPIIGDIRANDIIRSSFASRVNPKVQETKDHPQWFEGTLAAISQIDSYLGGKTDDAAIRKNADAEVVATKASLLKASMAPQPPKPVTARFDEEQVIKIKVATTSSTVPSPNANQGGGVWAAMKFLFFISLFGFGVLFFLGMLRRKVNSSSDNDDNLDQGLRPERPNPPPGPMPSSTSWKSQSRTARTTAWNREPPVQPVPPVSSMPPVSPVPPVPPVAPVTPSASTTASTQDRSRIGDIAVGAAAGVAIDELLRSNREASERRDRIDEANRRREDRARRQREQEQEEEESRARRRRRDEEEDSSSTTTTGFSFPSPISRRPDPEPERSSDNDIAMGGGSSGGGGASVSFADNDDDDDSSSNTSDSSGSDSSSSNDD